MENNIELSDELYSKIEKLSEQGNDLVDEDDFEGALLKFQTALDLLPEPKDQWEAAMWLYASMGDMYLFTEDFDAAKENFFNALNCPDGQESAFVHLRLGESLFELGEEEKSTDHLLQAYMLEGPEVFAEEEEKYLEFLQSKVEL